MLQLKKKKKSSNNKNHLTCYRVSNMRIIRKVAPLLYLAVCRLILHLLIRLLLLMMLMCRRCCENHIRNNGNSRDRVGWFGMARTNNNIIDVVCRRAVTSTGPAAAVSFIDSCSSCHSALEHYGLPALRQNPARRTLSLFFLLSYGCLATPVRLTWPEESRGARTHRGTINETHVHRQTRYTRARPRARDETGRWRRSLCHTETLVSFLANLFPHSRNSNAETLIFVFSVSAYPAIRLSLCTTLCISVSVCLFLTCLVSVPLRVWVFFLSCRAHLSLSLSLPRACVAHAGERGPQNGPLPTSTENFDAAATRALASFAGAFFFVVFCFYFGLYPFAYFCSVIEITIAVVHTRIFCIFGYDAYCFNVPRARSPARPP